ncbi:MAG: outer membrane beta-barrel protein, partial [Verrucomicrobia bacterium]|nr:outer membrane beta-barrel protein [Verrucomicrobiota bacterium]
LNLVKDQTYLGLGYEYKLRWFEDRDPDNSDHSHRFSLDLTHDFNENMSVDLGDEFVIAQEPEVLEPTGASRLRSNMDAIHNRAHVNFTTQLSRTYSLMAGYRNDLYNYDQSGAGSFSALLDRVEHRVTANLRSQLRPGTTGILGYQYRVVDYTSDDSLTFGSYLNPEVRNSDSHYVYAGFDHSFTPELLGSLRAGAQFTSYDNVAAGVDDSTTSPYIDANLSYAYAKGSNIAVGLRHERNQTDIAQVGGSLILDQETTSAYASVSHQLTAKLTANFVGMYANSSFGDSLADTSDNFWSLGFNMSYQINQYLLAETGYNFDDLDSDLGNRSFDRNRVYLGLKASY